MGVGPHGFQEHSTEVSINPSAFPVKLQAFMSTAERRIVTVTDGEQSHSTNSLLWSCV